MKGRLFGVLMALVIWIGCDDSETLTPSTTPEFKYSLPQGNHEYDAKIVDWYNRGDFYILYKYEPENIYFNVNSDWQEVIYDTVMKLDTWKLNNEYVLKGDTLYNYKKNGTTYKYHLGEIYVDDKGLPYIYEVYGDLIYHRFGWINRSGSYIMSEPDEVYVGKQLEWIEEMFLNFYPDTLLRIGIPMKLILCRDLYLSSVKRDYWYSFNNLFISHGDESIESMTQSDKLSIKEEVNSWFLRKRIINQIKKVMEKKGFFYVTDYERFENWEGDVPRTELYPAGLLSMNANIPLGESMSLPDKDLDNYIYDFLRNTKEKIEAEPVSGDYNFNDLTGILHSKKDVNGLIRKKYDIFIEGMYEIGINWNELVELYH